MSIGPREALVVASGVTLVATAMILVLADGMKVPLFRFMIIILLCTGLGTLAGAAFRYFRRG